MRLFVCLYVLIFLLLGQVNCSSSFSSNASSTQLCPHDQSFALLQLKNSFSFNSFASNKFPFASFALDQLQCHKSYPKMLSWEENVDCCSWDGVTCDRVTGHVISLDLSCGWLQGTIHSNSSLFLLPHLQRLNLAFNDFDHSQISSKFGGFTSLMHLNLSFSVFSGHIPLEIFHLSKLISLDLSYNYNGSTGINLLRLNTYELKILVQNLTKLRELDLSMVNMSSVELDSLSVLHSSLTTLSLKECGLRGKFPNNAFCLPNLQKLDLSNNYNLTVYFPKVNWSSTLKFLDLSSLNFVEGVPNSISNLQSLNYLDISSCSLSRSIPAFHGNLTKITHLDLSYNNFEGEIPSSLSNLGQLSFLDLSSNRFNGSIPTWFGNFTQMSSLRLSENNFDGQIPSSLSKLQKLTELDLSGNNFNGSIPAWLGNLTQMSTLYLFFDNFSGEIPTSLSKLDHLSVLDLSNNHFNGLIPAWLGNLTRLSDLYLSKNNFSGEIPLSLSKLDQLNSLSLWGNHFNGSIPAWLGNLTQVSYLDLSYNNFSGEIPLSLSKLDLLTSLYLSDNHFNGLIPAWFGNFMILRSLDLSSNNFSGQIPSWLSGEQLPRRSLQYLNLHSNMLQGPLPIPPPTTTFFSIANNKMTGEIHSLICNASSLEIINFSNNSLIGIIPQCLGYFSKSLSVLDLRMNSFHGTIPKTFVNNNSLRNLNFNGNKLEGLVPLSLVNCTKLEVLDLGNNKINDTFPYWLETLPDLQVLVLRSNRFHGPIRDSKAKRPFPKLRIIDLSNNSFSGPLPTRYIENLMAMMNVHENKTKPTYMGEDYYQDSVTVTMKGSEYTLQKILTIFSTIDFSSNRFQGRIPKSIGNLNSLIVLNFSHNSLMGHIPLSMENMSELESLDLSSNNLTGEIPGQLTSLTFLEVLNLSKNHLLGHIPRGNQFNTFSNDSYNENLGLCGAPLLKKCSDDDPPRPPPSIFNEDNDRGFASGFKWKAAFMGYGCGMIFGLAMGYLIFLTGKPEWLVRMIEGKHYKKVKRSNKSAPRRGRRRN